MQNKVAIFSDLHLGVHQNNDFWLDVSVEWADWFISSLDRLGITEVIFCGDWMHYRDSVEVKTLFKSSIIIKKFSRFKLHAVPGNHCCYYKNKSDIHSLSIMSDISHVNVYDTLTSIDVNNKKLVFCPWGTDIKDIPKCDIVFGHFELQTFRMNAFKICEHGDNPEKLLDKAPLVFSGHFHQRDEKHFSGKGDIIYIGNPFQMDFGDAYSKKGFYILDIEKSEYTFIENTETPKHLRILLSELIKSNPTDMFKNDVRNSIIKLVVDKNISNEHLDILVAKFTTYKPTELRIDYDVNYNRLSVPDDNITMMTDGSGMDIVSALSEFVNILSIENKAEVIDYVTSLYTKSIS